VTILHRGRLAKIDQRVFTSLDHTDGVQTVKVPVSAAVWSTWRRYCEAMGASMGEGVAQLIIGELETVIDAAGTTAGELATQLEQQAEERSLRLDARQRELEAQSEGLKRREEGLRTWEEELRTAPPAAVHAPYSVKVGRNERCPCGSGFKYKHCHGGPLR